MIKMFLYCPACGSDNVTDIDDDGWQFCEECGQVIIPDDDERINRE